MSNILTLTSIFIKNGIFLSNNKNTKKSKKDRSALVFGIVLLIYLFLFFIPITVLVNKFVKINGYGDVIISITLPIAALTSIVFGVFSITSVFYFNKDSEKILPFPIKSGELLIAKFLTSLIPQYFMLSMFIYPIILGAGIGMNSGALYYIYMTFIFLLIPIIPSILTSIVIMLLNKVFNINKRKNLFMYLMVAIVFIFSLGYGYGVSILFDANSDAMISLLMGNKEDILRITSYIFIFFNPAKYALVNSNEFIGCAAFISFIGLNLLGLLILYLLADKLYIKGLIIDKGINKNKKENIDNEYKMDKSSLSIALIKREWINIKRTPIYMLNIIVINLIFPIMFFIMSFIDNLSLKGFFNFNNVGVYFITLAILFAICNLGGTIGSSTCISREGKSIINLKSMPIGFKKIIDCKVYFYSFIDIIVTGLLEIPLFVIFGFPLYYLLVINIPFIFLILIINYIGILIDLYKCNLTWDDESEPIKQNINSFISLLITVSIASLLGIIGYFLVKSSFSLILAFFLFTIIVIVCYILLVLYIKKNQIKLFNKVG